MHGFIGSMDYPVRYLIISLTHFIQISVYLSHTSFYGSEILCRIVDIKSTVLHCPYVLYLTLRPKYDSLYQLLHQNLLTKEQKYFFFRFEFKLKKKRFYRYLFKCTLIFFIRDIIHTI